MTMLVQRAAGSNELPFALEDLKAHLRVDFEDDDAAIIDIGKTAAAEIEQFAQIALLSQTVTVTLIGPDLADGFMRLPIGPVFDGGELQVTADGVGLETMLILSGLRPVLYWMDDLNNLAPHQVTISYRAGFGELASHVPSDLAQALKDQAALHYDGRSPMDAKSLTTSPHMARIGARYRGVQA